jgi:hypothetical protein
MGLEKEKKDAEIQNFKRQLRWQQFIISQLYEALSSRLSVSPDTSREEIFERVAVAAKDGRMTADQVSRAERAVESYMRRRDNIRAVRDEYSEDDELFEYVTDRPPAGDIHVLVRPTTIMFRCSKKEDYARIYHLEKESIEAEEVERADKSGGVSISKGPPRLKGAVTAEKITDDNESEQKSIQTHEAEHAIQKLLRDHIYPDVTSEEEIPYITDLTCAKTVADIKEAAEKWLNHWLAIKSRSMKEEVLAFMKEDNNYDTDGLYELLTKTQDNGGLYWPSLEEREQVLSKMKGFLRGDDTFLSKAQTKIHEQMHTTMTKLDERIQKGLEAYQKLRSFGYSDKKISFMLMTEPLKKWPKTSKRMT